MITWSELIWLKDYILVIGAHMFGAETFTLCKCYCHTIKLFILCTINKTKQNRNLAHKFQSHSHQWTKARLRNSKSNFLLRFSQTSPIAVLFDSMQRDLVETAKSLFGGTTGSLWLMPTLNPVGHHDTNWTLLIILTSAMAALTSFGRTSPR